MADICLTAYLHWETTGKVLQCEKCPFFGKCEKHKHFPNGDCK